MAMQEENEFTIWRLEAGEYAQAVNFTELQRKLLQSYKGQVAHKTINLDLITMSVDDYKMQHAYLTGKRDLLNELLSLVADVESETKSDEHAPRHTPPQLAE